MARLYPPALPAKAPRSEHVVFDALSTLDDAWMIFCGLPWQAKRWGRQGDGEADFVLAHRSKGILVLEVKGGSLETVDGEWFQTSRDGFRKKLSQSPAQQAMDSKKMLEDYLAEQVSGLGGRARFGHGVVFPFSSVDGDLAPDTPRSIVADAGDLRAIGRVVNRIAGHWDKTTTFDEKQLQEVRQALAPTKQLKLKLRDRADEITEKLIELTNQQANILNVLRYQNRAMITGGAGTGKTVLAVQRARQLADSGDRVLLVCYNAPLGNHLEDQVADVENITAGGFHKIARGLAATASMLPEGEPNDDWWSVDLPGVLPDAAEKLGITFDAIVVDEGQDFRPNWWTALQLLLANPDEGAMYVFADAQQDLYRTGWQPPFDGAPFPLDTNCRNTVQIADKVGAVFERAQSTLGVDGPEPRFVRVNTSAQLPKELAKIIRKLIGDEGFAPRDLVILSTTKNHVDGLRGQAIDGHKFTKLGRKGIAVETVQRFKGLESDVVVLILDEVETPEDRSLAYVGMSRAKSVLYVLGSSEAQDAVNWS